MATIRATEPRPLRDVVNDFEWRGQKVSKALAEEAVHSVAADLAVQKGEVDLLQPYADGTRDLRVKTPTDRATWKEGSEAGRALFNSLAEVIDRIHDVENRDALRRPQPNVLNPFTWFMGGIGDWPKPTKDAAIGSAADLMKEVRQQAMGWVDNSVSRLLESYPKAFIDGSSYSTKLKPDVQAAVTRLKRDWLAGKVADETNLAAALKPLLERKYA